VDLGLMLLGMMRVLMRMLLDLVRNGRVERIGVKALRRHGYGSGVLSLGRTRTAHAIGVTSHACLAAFSARTKERGARV
jgi:hypothetical protein